MCMKCLHHVRTGPAPSLPAAALRRVVSVLCLGSTVELALMVSVQANRSGGHESRRTGQTLLLTA